MSGKYALAPEFASQPSFTIPSNRWLLRLVNGLLRWQRRRFAWDDAVSVRRHAVPVEGGSPVEVFEIAPKDLTGPAPALVDYHGGGFFLSYAAGHLDYAQRYALETRGRVFFPDYRLSIDHPFPAAFEDACATLAWVFAEADRLGVDRERVAVIGDSAGGALAAGVAQWALDHGVGPLCAQILVYPVTDHETKTGSALAFDDTPMWRTASNRNMWKVYLRGTGSGRAGDRAAVPAYAAPLHRERFEDLPRAWVEVAEFDPLRDEGIAYARALEAAGVPVELHEIRGAVHGYDLVEGSPTAEAVLKERLVAIRRLLSSPARSESSSAGGDAGGADADAAPRT